MRSKTAVLGGLATLAALLVTANAQESRRPSSFIANGVNASGSRYPYFVSLRYLFNTSKPQAFCGGSLISDRLVLTAAHCALDQIFQQYYADALPSDFRQLGFSFNGLPNTYIIGGNYQNKTLQLSALVGATNRAANTSATPIIAWFVHPYFDPETLQYDVAIALLATPVSSPQIKLFNPAGDIYKYLSSSANITAIGLGNLQGEEFAEVEEAINPNFVNQNNSTSRQLAETTIGSLVDRTLCGKALTADGQQNVTNGSLNLKVGSPAIIVGPGQMCVGPAYNASIEAAIRRQAQSIANAPSLPANVVADLTGFGISAKDAIRLSRLIPGYNDTCDGDSGGPILIKGATSAQDVQIGTVSFGGQGLCGNALPSVYTNVPAFLNSTTYDSFLADVLKAVPNRNGQSLSNLVSTVPGVQSAG